MRIFFKKHVDPFLPLYIIVPLICCFLYNNCIYFFSSRIMENSKHYDFTTKLDRMIPVVPSFIVIYVSCFLVWAIGYIIIAKQGKEVCYRFITAEIMAKTVCGLCFFLIPTTNTRPLLAGDGFFEKCLLLLYQTDKPYNLFPSIHCLVSWFCYIGVRGNQKISKYYRCFILIFALLVFVSTLTLKQHYIIDVISAVILAEFMYRINQKKNWYQPIEKMFEALNRIIWGK